MPEAMPCADKYDHCWHADPETIRTRGIEVCCWCGWVRIVHCVWGEMVGPSAREHGRWSGGWSDVSRLVWY